MLSENILAADVSGSSWHEGLEIVVTNYIGLETKPNSTAYKMELSRDL